MARRSIMGFNLGAFLGGAASGGSQILDERRAQAEEIKLLKKNASGRLPQRNVLQRELEKLIVPLKKNKPHNY